MLKLSVLPADIYVVVNKTVFNDNDRRILTMLYQPIIGSSAVNLYFTLWSFLDRNEIKSLEWTHHHLMVNMGLKLDYIIEAREKLEGIGLLKVYVKKGNVNNFIYELYSPIDASQFFNNPILNVALYNNLGKQEYEKTLSYFKIPRIVMTDYEEITCKFNEIYDSCSGNLLDYNFDDIRHKNRIGFSVEPKFDLDNIIGIIPEEMLNYRSFTKEIRDFIYKLSFIYNLNEDNLSNIIRNSINEKHNIDREMLKINCRNFYNFENSGKLPSLIYRNQPEYLRKPAGDTSKRAKTIYYFETTSPYEFLYQKNNNTEPNGRELKIIEYLMIDLNMNPGVVNVLVDYVLRINNNKLVKSFVDSIASQWVRSKVETVEQAMNLAEKEYKNKKNIERKVIKNINVVDKPEWFNKEIEEVSVSLDKQIEFEKKLKELRGEL